MLYIIYILGNTAISIGTHYYAYIYEIYTHANIMWMHLIVLYVDIYNLLTIPFQAKEACHPNM